MNEPFPRSDVPRIAFFRANCLMISLLLALAGCGGGGGTGGDAIESTIENFMNSFDGVSASGSLISLQLILPQSSMNQSSGTFDSSDSAMSVQSPNQTSPTTVAVSGSFNGATFSITLANPPSSLDASYTGTFSDANTIMLAGSSGTLTLRRSGGSFTASVSGSWTGSDPTGAAWYIQLGKGLSASSGQTFLINGTELFAGVTSPVTGYVSVSYVELHISRASGEIVVVGQFPTSSGSINGDAMTFTAGGSLKRGGTPDAHSVIFLGLNSSTNNDSLFKVDLLGLSQLQISSQSGPDAWVWNYYISPDHRMVAYIAGASQTASNDVFIFTVAGGSVKKLTNIAAPAGDIGTIMWAPDSSAIAFIAGTSGSSVSNAYYQKITDPSTTTLSNAITAATEVGWSYDSCQIAYSADQTTPKQYELYVASTCGGYSGKVSGALPSAASSVNNWNWSPTADTIAYVADERVAGIPELFTVDTTTLAITQISPPLSTGRMVESQIILWSPSGASLAFQDDGNSALQFNLFVASADGSKISNVSGGALTSSAQSLQYDALWSPNSQSLAFTFLTPAPAGADEVDLYVVSATGSNGENISNPALTSGGVGNFYWSPNSASMLYSFAPSLQPSNWATAPLAGGLSTFPAAPVSTCGDQSGGWSPSGAQVAFFAQASASAPCNVMISAPDGSTAALVSNTLSAQAAPSNLTWYSDGNRLLFLSNDDVLAQGFTSNATELYVVYSRGAAAIKISSIPGQTLGVLMAQFDVL